MTLTAGQLRAALEGVPDNAEIIIGIKTHDPNGGFRCTEDMHPKSVRYNERFNELELE